MTKNSKNMLCGPNNTELNRAYVTIIDVFVLVSEYFNRRYSFEINGESFLSEIIKKRYERLFNNNLQSFSDENGILTLDFNGVYNYSVPFIYKEDNKINLCINKKGYQYVYYGASFKTIVGTFNPDEMSINLQISLTYDLKELIIK